MDMTACIAVDSREIARAFGRRHHNVLAAIDLVLRQCPAAVPHYRFEYHPVTAGLGGTRYVRHALIDREGFMLLAMSFPSTQRDTALTLALTLIGPSSLTAS
ncbi:Rha family transcriptional regulator [Sphingomonas sanguinis]|jgi:phage regulator Rha-like protein|uniref:Rha family transcriptional regulator n=1 Tax=Sphingomonas sanguinis TaxID=33051 RepID=A0A7Y7UR20_9SPHN|nr:Rha family transcriptional regulator [Sphingomonas sanguinis]MBZ6382261.1 Rha family transcriptional regulator [Sphingomonas sanguinis]NNG50847.1 Rha family transcriptional regulator [Sphingomonas sanguinis]NNG54365.1 Rha family transcriptional regulator [Sphingomonas sanguinis]NVP31559.1 Rha family transcriptional regulator [Sphingomonas sanguinis]